MSDKHFEPKGILAAAAAHYDSLRGQKIAVPEWGVPGQLVPVIYYDPITASQAQNVQGRAKGNEARAVALAVMLLAKDESGAPLFEDDTGTLAYLMNKVDPRVTARIGKAILGVAEEAENLGE